MKIRVNEDKLESIGEWKIRGFSYIEEKIFLGE